MRFFVFPNSIEVARFGLVKNETFLPETRLYYEHLCRKAMILHSAFNMDLSDVRLTILLYNVTIPLVYGVYESL